MTAPTNEAYPDKLIPLVELFGPTIQGEGAMVGHQTIFLRLGGCDFKCGRCDSLHAVLPDQIKKNAEYLTVDQLIARTLEFMSGPRNTEWITLSGGNPAIHDLSEFVWQIGMHPSGPQKKIAVETQGSVWRNWIRGCTAVTVSPKGPGMEATFDPNEFDIFVQNLAYHPGFTVKVVIFDQRDIEFAVELMHNWSAIKPRMYFSIGNVTPPAPAKSDLRPGEDQTHDDFVRQTLNNYRTILEEVMQDPRCSSVRILPQLHTLLWGNELGR